MRVVFINRFFHPDISATSQLLSELAFALAKCGIKVTVITSRLMYNDANVRLDHSERIKGVKVIRIATTGFGRAKLFGRLLDYATFYLFATCALFRNLGRGDVVVAKTDPPMLSLVAAPVAWFRNARHVNWLQDIYPEVATAMGLGDDYILKTIFSLLKWPRDASLRNADLNIVLGRRMAEYMRGIGVPTSKIQIIENWADGQLVRPIPSDKNPLRREWGLEHAFVVGYSGNFGRAHYVGTIVEAISWIEQKALSMRQVTQTGARNGEFSVATLRDVQSIRWLFVGGGVQMDALKDEVNRRGLTSVIFRPYQPRTRLSESLSVPDVHIVSLRPEFEGLVVPSKYYGIAAAGRAAIFIGDQHGEIARLLALTGAGFSVNQFDGEALGQKVLELAANPDLVQIKGARARQHFEVEYDLPIAVEKWRRALTGL